MANHTFFCVDAHTCGNPVRVVAGGGPQLEGRTMSERRQHFLAEYDWIRTGLQSAELRIMVARGRKKDFVEVTELSAYRKVPETVPAGPPFFTGQL